MRFRGGTTQILTLFAMSNFWMARRHFLSGAREVCRSGENGCCEALAAAKMDEIDSRFGRDLSSYRFLKSTMTKSPETGSYFRSSQEKAFIHISYVTIDCCGHSDTMVRCPNVSVE